MLEESFPESCNPSSKTPIPVTSAPTNSPHNYSLSVNIGGHFNVEKDHKKMEGSKEGMKYEREILSHLSKHQPLGLFQQFSTCGSKPLGGLNDPFTGVTHQTSCISDISIMIHNSSKTKL